MSRKATPRLHLLSRSSSRFKDREEAGKLLAIQLSEYRGRKAVVLGIPRGGMVVAREIARELRAELDIILAHKLRTPGHEELAMGSVSEDGRLFLHQEVVRNFNLGQTYINQEKMVQLEEIRRRTELFRSARPKVHLKGRIVIVTDDGVATGATTRAAFWAARLEQPGELIGAIPVGPEETIRKLADDVDVMYCLRAPPSFAAVGQFYQRFYPVQDEEVLEILREAVEDSQH